MLLILSELMLYIFSSFFFFWLHFDQNVKWNVNFTDSSVRQTCIWTEKFSGLSVFLFGGENPYSSSPESSHLRFNVYVVSQFILRLWSELKYSPESCLQQHFETIPFFWCLCSTMVLSGRRYIKKYMEKTNNF